MLYAEKALIGRLEPGQWGPPESYEWYMVAPPGIGLQILCSGVQDLSRDLAMAQANIRNGVVKLAEEGVDCIIAGGLPVIAHGNKRYSSTVDFLTSVRESVNVPVISALTATVESINALGAKRLAVATPYPPDVDKNVKELLEDCGFEVLTIKGLNIPKLKDIGRLPEEASYRLAKQVFEEAPLADAIFISCPGWPVLRNIAPLEAELKRPILTTTTMQVYTVLKTLRLRLPVQGFGALLADLPNWG